MHSKGRFCPRVALFEYSIRSAIGGWTCWADIREYPNGNGFFSQALFGSLGLSEVKNDWAFLKSNASAKQLFFTVKSILNQSEELCEKIASEHVFPRLSRTASPA